MIQIVSLVGSLLILAAFSANQLGRMTAEQRLYTVLNLVGSAILAVVALKEEQWGFLLLEGVWALVSAYALVRPRAATASSAA
jgi:hypothetical protein